jgi:hypothetical protein
MSPSAGCGHDRRERGPPTSACVSPAVPEFSSESVVVVVLRGDARAELRHYLGQSSSEQLCGPVKPKL